jgi:hypothetical protein
MLDVQNCNNYCCMVIQQQSHIKLVYRRSRLLILLIPEQSLLRHCVCNPVQIT